MSLERLPLLKSAMLLALLLSITIDTAAVNPQQTKQQAQQQAQQQKAQQRLKLAIDYIEQGDLSTAQQYLNQIADKENWSLNTDANNWSLMPLVKLLRADCYFQQHDYSAAEEGYRDWLNSYPAHAMMAEVLFELAQLNLQILLRDSERYIIAEKQLKEIDAQFPEFAAQHQVKRYLLMVQERHAKHDLGIVQFYFERRDAWKVAEARCRDIINNYPDFSELDAALWYLAGAIENQQADGIYVEDGDCAQYYRRIAQEFPESKYYEKAVEKLQNLGGSLPPIDHTAVAQRAENAQIIEELMENLYGPSVIKLRRGVLIDKENHVDLSAFR